MPYSCVELFLNCTSSNPEKTNKVLKQIKEGKNLFQTIMVI